MTEAVLGTKPNARCWRLLSVYRQTGGYLSKPEAQRRVRCDYIDNDIQQLRKLGFIEREDTPRSGLYRVTPAGRAFSQVQQCRAIAEAQAR